jgi:hypothetical protein
MEGCLDLESFDQEERGALAALGLRPGTFGVGSACPDPALLLAAEDGVLDAIVANKVRAHVAICPACTMLTSDLASLFAEAETDEAERRIAARIAEVRPKPRRLMWGLATGGLLIAASLAGVVVTRGDVQVPVVPIATVRVAMPGSLPSVFYIDVPAEPEDLELALRGGAPATGSARAAGTPDRPAADETEWREAVAFVQAGDVASARRVLSALCVRPTWRGALACAGLIELDRRGKR